MLSMEEWLNVVFNRNPKSLLHVGYNKNTKTNKPKYINNKPMKLFLKLSLVLFLNTYSKYKKIKNNGYSNIPVNLDNTANEKKNDVMRIYIFFCDFNQIKKHNIANINVVQSVVSPCVCWENEIISGCSATKTVIKSADLSENSFFEKK